MKFACWFLLLVVSTFAEGSTATLRAMFYNVENLFDYSHENGKDDWEFLPRNYPGKAKYCAQKDNEYYRKRCLEADWNQHKFAIKLTQIRKVVTSGGLPDILGLCEVENSFAASKLATMLGYSDYIITEGVDPRGIDIALLYNKKNPHLTYLRHRIYRLRTGRHLQKPTRDILEVEFNVTPGRNRLVVYVVHFPSQRSPSQARMVAARRLIELIREQERRDRRTHILAMGDFNVIAQDHPHPFRELFDSRLFDAHSASLENTSWERRIAMPPGTYFYPPNMQWNKLDRIFYNKNMRDGTGLEIDLQSFQVLAYPWLTKTFTYKKPGEFLLGSTIKNVPKRYNFKATSPTKAGYSDHFALRVNLAVTTSR